MMISLKNASKSYGEHLIIDDVDLEVESGSRLAIIGPSGCGKTTLLKLILGLEPLDQGQIHLLGTDMKNASEADKHQVLRRVGMAFQQGALFDYMTVEENLSFAIEHMTDLDREQSKETIQRLLEGVKLGRTHNMHPYELSGGMQRRVGIARALATDPELAIFDEPTSGLDPVTSTIILNMIRDITQHHDKTTAVIATSSVEIALRFADRMVVLNEGKIIADDRWQTLLVEGSDWVRHFLGVRLIGIDIGYARELKLPDAFIREHWGEEP